MAMFLQIDHHCGVPIYRQVIDQIRRQILAGRLAAGAQLDSVRDLSSQLKVNPMTISKAYGFLEMEGLAERRRGVGLFVAVVKEDEKGRMRQKLLEDIFGQAATAAWQFDVPPQEAAQTFAEIYRQLQSKNGRPK